MIGMLLAGLSLGWLGGLNSQWLLEAIFTSRDAYSAPQPGKIGVIDAVVDRIIKVESNGDPNLKNKRSSAVGLAGRPGAGIGG